MNESVDTPSLDIIVKTVEQYGCKLVDIDLDNHILNIEGPEAAQTACALALEKLLS
jgi:hypothetical protein